MQANDARTLQGEVGEVGEVGEFGRVESNPLNAARGVIHGLLISLLLWVGLVTIIYKMF
jgi:hypothetical protein